MTEKEQDIFTSDRPEVGISAIVDIKRKSGISHKRVQVFLMPKIFEAEIVDGR
mgnify:CR=1 FL=1